MFANGHLERVQADRITVSLIVPLYLIDILEHYITLTVSGQGESALAKPPNRGPVRRRSRGLGPHPHAIITDRFPLERAAGAYATARGGKAAVPPHG
jgi:hypothetical protein